MRDFRRHVPYRRDASQSRDGSRRSGRDHRLSIGSGCNGGRRTNFSAQAARCNGVERDGDHSQLRPVDFDTISHRARWCDRSSSQLFEELCAQFAGRINSWQLKTLIKRVKVWRQDARARGVAIDHINWSNINNKPRGRLDPFRTHWAEMLQCLEAQPDQTAKELLIAFRAR